MNTARAMELAETHLKQQRIDFVADGKVVNTIGEAVEISFPSPDTLIPGAVVDPPDIRVLVHEDGRVENVLQM